MVYFAELNIGLLVLIIWGLMSLIGKRKTRPKRKAEQPEATLGILDSINKALDQQKKTAESKLPPEKRERKIDTGFLDFPDFGSEIESDLGLEFDEEIPTRRNSDEELMPKPEATIEVAEKLREQKPDLRKEKAEAGDTKIQPKRPRENHLKLPRNLTTMQKAIVLKEILDRPVARRQRRGMG